MRSIEKRAVLALSCIAFTALTTPAFSKPHPHRAAHRAVIQAVPAMPGLASQADSNTIAYPTAQILAAEAPVRSRRGRAARAIGSQPGAAFASADPTAAAGGISLAGTGLVGEARRYLGTNPTGRGSL